MKNIQIIDGALNSIFEIYEVSDSIFQRLFPNCADVAFAEDISENDPIWDGFYKNRVRKKEVNGIHGTLHLFGKLEKSPFFPTKQEADVEGKVTGK